MSVPWLQVVMTMIACCGFYFLGMSRGLAKIRFLAGRVDRVRQMMKLVEESTQFVTHRDNCSNVCLEGKDGAEMPCDCGYTEWTEAIFSIVHEHEHENEFEQV